MEGIILTTLCSQFWSNHSRRVGGMFALYSPLRILHPGAEIVKRRITQFIPGLRLNRLFDILTEKWFSVLVEPFPNALELGLLRCLNRWSDYRHLRRYVENQGRITS